MLLKWENLPATPTTTNMHAHMAANIVAESGITTAAFILSTLWKTKTNNIREKERERKEKRVCRSINVYFEMNKCFYWHNKPQNKSLNELVFPSFGGGQKLEWYKENPWKLVALQTKVNRLRMKNMCRLKHSKRTALCALKYGKFRNVYYWIAHVD